MLVLVIWVIRCFERIAGECDVDELKSAANYIQTSTGQQMKSTAWETGEKYVLSCKPTEDLKHRTWTNNIRSLYTVDSRLIDYINEDGLQPQEITVKCVSSSFVPDIFTGQDTWCAVGCALVPAEFTLYLNPTYNSNSIGQASKGVPILPDNNLVINVQCKDGYSQVNGDIGNRALYCTDYGWLPNLKKLLACTGGCSDLSDNIGNGSVIYTKNTALGEAPFTVGDRIGFKCNTYYKLVGSEVITCDSGNRWTDSVPKCVLDDSLAPSNVRKLFPPFITITCFSFFKLLY